MSRLHWLPLRPNMVYFGPQTENSRTVSDPSTVNIIVAIISLNLAKISQATECLPLTNAPPRPGRYAPQKLAAPKYHFSGVISDNFVSPESNKMSSIGKLYWRCTFWRTLQPVSLICLWDYAYLLGLALLIVRRRVFASGVCVLVDMLIRPIQTTVC